MRTIGVLGGMGPAATVDFLAKLVAARGAARDADHPRVLVDMNPAVPDRNAALAGTGPSPGPVLRSMAEGLVRAGAEMLAMPCNAAHAWEADIREAGGRFVSMIAVAADAAAGPGSVGLLAADATIAAGLYQRAAAGRQLDLLLPPPDEQARLMNLIRAVKAGRTGAPERGQMQALAARMAALGATRLLAACTEVPLILSDAPVPVIDATEALARAVLLDAA